MTKEELLKHHTTYTAWLDEWRFYIRSYLGGKHYRDGDYLVQHPFESKENYARRKDIAYYYNYCQPIIDIFVSLLFKKEPTRNYGDIATDPLFQSFLIDADLTGNTYPQFIREMGRFAAVYGRVSVLVDKPISDVVTVAEAQAGDMRPYCTMITPENIPNWSYTRLANGRTVLNRVHVVEERDDNGEPILMRVWGRFDWLLYDLTVVPEAEGHINPIDIGVHNLGVVPIVTVYNKNSITPMLGISDIEDIAGVNKNIYHLCSDAQEIIENTAFPMLAEAYSNESETKEVGPKNIMQFDPELPNSKPVWLEAPHSSLKEIRESISQNRRTIYQTANLLGIYISGESKQPPAGIALEIENQQRDAVLVEKASNMEQAEKQILDIYLKWEDKTSVVEIKYSADFSIRDMDMNTQNIITLLQTNAIQTPLGWQALLKKLVRNLLGDLKKEDRFAIYKEIEDSKPTPMAINPMPTGGISNKGSGD